jgi:hypothetical protein
VTIKMATTRPAQFAFVLIANKRLAPNLVYYELLAHGCGG